MVRPLYRARQAFAGLRPRIEEADRALVNELVSEGEARLFFTMTKRDQRHALEVTQRLLAAELNDADLLAAALLHDCGKGAVPLWLRVANVLAPALVRRTARAGDHGWRGAAYRLVHHPVLGARLAAEAGASVATVRLIEGAVEPGERARLARLQAADDKS